MNLLSLPETAYNTTEQARKALNDHAGAEAICPTDQFYQEGS